MFIPYGGGIRSEAISYNFSSEHGLIQVWKCAKFEQNSLCFLRGKIFSLKFLSFVEKVPAGGECQFCMLDRVWRLANFTHFLYLGWNVGTTKWLPTFVIDFSYFGFTFFYEEEFPDISRYSLIFPYFYFGFNLLIYLNSGLKIWLSSPNKLFNIWYKFHNLYIYPRTPQK